MMKGAAQRCAEVELHIRHTTLLDRLDPQEGTIHHTTQPRAISSPPSSPFGSWVKSHGRRNTTAARFAWNGPPFLSPTLLWITLSKKMFLALQNNTYVVPTHEGLLRKVSDTGRYCGQAPTGTHSWYEKTQALRQKDGVG